MSVAAVLLAWAMFALDSQVPNAALADSRFVLSGTVGEMRSALLNMAGTVLATAGVVFTLLTLPLSTVAAQYGSRLLRVFLGDRTTQFVLGMFVATFVYCMAGALSIPPASVEQEGPQLTATVGVYLMLATFATLILLVQHISTMLQAPNIAAAAGAELREVVDAEILHQVTSGGDPKRGLQAQPAFQGAPDALGEPEGYAVRARRTGYIQYIDPQIMLTLAREKDLVIHLVRKPGHYVQAGAVVALVSPAGRVDEQLAKLIHRALQIGNGRTPTQDIEYAVNQLTEMAVRAMSPAINDPFTAMTCLDHVGDGLAKFIRQGEKGSHYYDLDGRLRLDHGTGYVRRAARRRLRHATPRQLRQRQRPAPHAGRDRIDRAGGEVAGGAPPAARTRLPDRGGEPGWRPDRAGSAGDPVARPGPTGKAGRRGVKPAVATASQTLSKKPGSCL